MSISFIKKNVETEAGKMRPKASFETFSKTLKDPQFTLPSNFFSRNAEGVVLSLAVCIILTYGFSSITYFTIELFNKNNPLKQIYQGVFIGNMLDGIMLMLTSFLFIRYIADKIKRNYMKYMGLFMLVLLNSAFTQMFVGFFYWRKLDDSIFTRDMSQTNYTLIYLLIPPTVACIYFFFWQRSQQITRKISAQEFELIHLEKLKTQAELDALQARINPHFLHNSLNSIAGLVHDNPDKAEQMTLLLSKLFRYTTGAKDQHFNSIKEELEIVRTYLAIEQVRFGDRLIYDLDVEKDLENKQIPRFLLQPIVENAIKHGISKLSQQGLIRIKITKEGSNLSLAVHDNGAPFSDNFFTGYGLQSIQDKLKLLYGSEAQFIVENADYKQVIIKLPIK
jgi:two-component system, LytTR family, sensor kinase